MDKTGARRGEQTGKERAMRQWTPYRKAQKNKAQRQNKCPRNMKLEAQGKRASKIVDNSEPESRNTHVVAIATSRRSPRGT